MLTQQQLKNLQDRLLDDKTVSCPWVYLPSSDPYEGVLWCSSCGRSIANKEGDYDLHLYTPTYLEEKVCPLMYQDMV